MTMPSNIELLLENQNDVLDYDALIQKYPWIVERDRKCVLSPDSDGLLCGLFMARYRNWEIVGFYDDKIGVINRDYLTDDVVFLDGEIFRHEIKSMGHHMVLWNKRKIPDNWYNFDSCIQPNNMRNYDGKTNFRLKYPLASIHMLASIIAYQDYKDGNPMVIPDSAIPPLFFTDGVFQVLFTYPENVLNWLSYLRIHEDWNPLKNIFESDTYSVFNLMKKMNEFFRQRDEISVSKERGDRLKLSTKLGNPYNIIPGESGVCKINDDAKERIERFLTLIGNMTTWRYETGAWKCWKNLQYFKFTKHDFNGDSHRVNNGTFDEFIKRNPLSWAMTSGNNIEYTIEEPSILYINRTIPDGYMDVTLSMSDIAAEDD